MILGREISKEEGARQVCPLKDLNLNSVDFFYILHLMRVYISRDVGVYLQVVRLHSSKYYVLNAGSTVMVGSRPRYR